MESRTRRRPAKSNKIKKYRKPINLNIGMILFLAVFVYVAYFVVGYFRYSPPKPYEVKEGALSVNSVFKGLALRSETVVTTQTAGYLNYYVREGERVAKGDLVYTVDETGRLKDYIESSNVGQNSLSSGELAEFRSEIVNFMHGFEPDAFSTVYDFKYALKGSVLKIANADMLENLTNGGIDLKGTVQTCYAPATGIVSYWTDGYENLRPDQVNEQIFKEKYDSKDTLFMTELSAAQEPAYKLSTDENWSIIIPVDAVYGTRLEEEEYVRVRFLKNQYESWAQVSLLHNSDGNLYAQLDFNNSMVTFVSERFLDIEIVLEEQKGLKIPNSSIAEREFFLVPERFVRAEGDSLGVVLKHAYGEDGSVVPVELELDIYSYDEETGEYYFDTNQLGRGDILLLLDSQENFIVNKSATLIGVYNMNKGYTDFREIEILAQNAEYAIVRSNTRYGLNVYDNIVLNADSVNADEFIFE